MSATLLAAATALPVGASRDWLVLPFYRRVARRLYHRLSAPLIARGWVER